MIRLYTRDILQGLEYLHTNGLAHCDIKSKNVLVSKEGAKIADFGCAKFVEKVGGAMSEFSGTPAFMAPEVARGEEQGFPADLWALGCTIIEMATGNIPWTEHQNDPVSALYQIGFSSEISGIQWKQQLEVFRIEFSAERIKKLVECTCPVDIPNWTWEEDDWIRVRSNFEERDVISVDAPSVPTAFLASDSIIYNKSLKACFFMKIC
ncbi:hypothetical protein GH714_023885 [Hevea brasiliensis]|uniref:Protein kinase domain-containing protein n=1 Tax=Hevea brasiliensis TaxID=3981 RepID=A0A6A6MPI4_HEVBR|nr:hypothetical protein GH714_023885 [Hevea brasiliensis]